MKVYDTADLRNMALIGHGGCGKTSLVSALLFVAGAVNRLGRVEDGTTVTDFDEEEIARKISLQTALAHLEWKGKKVNLVDTPGYAAFVADAKAGLAAADLGLVVLDALAGVQVVTERVFGYCEEANLPVAFLVNKLDRENASFERALEAIRSRFDRRAVAVQIPIGEEQGFEGVVDLVANKAHRYSRDGSGQCRIEEIGAGLDSAAAGARSRLVEAVAETEDALMEAYFEAGELGEAELREGLRKAIASRRIFPVFCAAATAAIGARSLLDAVVEFFPSPDARGEVVGTSPADGSELRRKISASEPAALFVFKTIVDPHVGRLSLFRLHSGSLRPDSSLSNPRRGATERLGTLGILQGKQIVPVGELRAGDLGVVAKLKETRTGDTLCDPAHPILFPEISWPAPAISYAVEPRSKGDEEKISLALQRLTEEDPVLRVGRDGRTHELLVSGTGQVHVEVAIAKMKKKFGVEATLKQPKVPYLETIKKKVGPVQGRHKKQTGGRGQFGDCWIVMEPLPRGAGFEFVDKIFGGAIPQNFRPAVEKGILESAQKGPLAGYPVVDFRVTLTDGSYHTVDSSEIAFKIAGSLAFKAAMEQAKPTLLEPIMSVEITAPEECMGEIMGDLSSRRGRPQGMDSRGGYQIIRALVPLAEMLTYASALKSITSDRGSYTMEFDHYEEVPPAIQEKIIAEAAKERGEEAEK
jgi:elongation factor G